MSKEISLKLPSVSCVAGLPMWRDVRFFFGHKANRSESKVVLEHAANQGFVEKWNARTAHAWQPPHKSIEWRPVQLRDKQYFRNGISWLGDKEFYLP